MLRGVWLQVAARCRAPRPSASASVARPTLRISVRWGHQRLPLCDDVDIVIVDNVAIHGTRKHARNTLCAAVTTDGLRNQMQHEITWFLEYPFPTAGMIPTVVTRVARFIRDMNDKGAFVRPGDLLDIRDDGEVAPFGNLGADAPDVKAVAFAPLPLHDEYWLGEHEYRRTPHPTLLARVLCPGERAYCGAVGLGPVLAVEMGLFQYAPCLPYIASKRIPGPGAEDLSRAALEEGGDMTLLTDALGMGALPPSPVRLNGSTAVLNGSMLTLSVPSASAEMVHAALAETVSQRTDEEVTLLCDPAGVARAPPPAALAAPADGVAPPLDQPPLVPLQPSKGKEVLRSAQPPAHSGSGVILGYHRGEAGLDAFDVVEQAGVAMSDADACGVASHGGALWKVTLRQRSWLRLLEAFATQRGFVCPAEEADGVHFEVRFTQGAELELYQEQAQRSNAAFQKLKGQGMQAYGEAAGSAGDDVEEAAPSAPPRQEQPAELLQVGGEEEEAGAEAGEKKKQKRRLVLLAGGAESAASLGEADKMKVRMAGGGAVLQQSMSELKAPMTPAQFAQYRDELNMHKVLADEVKDSLRRRDAEQLEGNVIRIVWSYDDTKPQELQALQAELKAAESAWDRWRRHLVATTMLHLEQSPDLYLQQQQGARGPDLSPNLCMRVLPKEVTGEGETVFGLMVRDELIPDTASLMAVLVEDELLQDCPISFGFDLFLNVARRGSYSSARRQAASVSDMQAHYQQLSRDAADRLASLESEHRKLAERERHLDQLEARLQQGGAAAETAGGAAPRP